MGKFYIRNAEQTDIDQIVDIYNSNSSFLLNHIGKSQIDALFIQNEFTTMRQMGFRSCVILQQENDSVVGVIDYKPGDCVYLSLLMLNSEFQGNGNGRICYQLFEKCMLQSGTQKIRIDVVNDYPGNVVPFWEKQNFMVDSFTKLIWGEKCSDAVVMTKAFPLRGRWHGAAVTDEVFP